MSKHVHTLELEKPTILNHIKIAEIHLWLLPAIYKSTYIYSC